MQSELSKTRIELRDKIAPSVYARGADLSHTRLIPEHGRGKEWLEKELEGMKKLGEGVEGDKISGAIYHVRVAKEDVTLESARSDVIQGGDELNEIIMKAMSTFLLSNPLHPDVFPGVRKMESEVVSICLNLWV
jgi:sphinganine-1-phosphate aldolase